MLNSTSLGTFTWQDCMVAEIIGVTKQHSTVETTESLDVLLLGVVDETLKQIFREAGGKVIYDYIWNECHLKREEIAEKPEVFSASLKRPLGSGTPVIEKMIPKKLYCKLRLEYAEKKDHGFSDHMKEMKTCKFSRKQ